MLTNLQHFMACAGSISEVDLDFQSLPMHIYCKDMNGKYMACNDAQAETVGYQKGSELLGLSDYDLCWSEHAELFQKNDQHVITNKKPITTIEPIINATKITDRVFSYKTPLSSKFSKKIIGVSAISIKVSDEFNPFSSMQSLISANNKLVSCLTKNEKWVLSYVVRGLTSKAIGKELGLSFRTIETFMENIKHKLQVSTKNELIIKVQGEIFNW